MTVYKLMMVSDVDHVQLTCIAVYMYQLQLRAWACRSLGILGSYC